MEPIKTELAVAEELSSRQEAQAEVAVPDPTPEEAEAAIAAAIVNKKKAGAK